MLGRSTNPSIIITCISHTNTSTAHPDTSTYDVLVRVLTVIVYMSLIQHLQIPSFERLLGVKLNKACAHDDYAYVRQQLQDRVKQEIATRLD